MNTQEILDKIEPEKRARLEYEASILFPGIKVTCLTIVAILGIDEYEHYRTGAPIYKRHTFPPKKKTPLSN